MDDEILEYVGQHDQLYEVDVDEDEFQLAASFDLTKRPATGNEDDDNALVLICCLLDLLAKYIIDVGAYVSVRRILEPLL